MGWGVSAIGADPKEQTGKIIHKGLADGGLNMENTIVTEFRVIFVILINWAYDVNLIPMPDDRYNLIFDTSADVI